MSIKYSLALRNNKNNPIVAFDSPPPSFTIQHQPIRTTSTQNNSTHHTRLLACLIWNSCNNRVDNMPKRVAVKGKRAAPPKVRRKVYNNDPEPESSGSDGGGSVLFDDDDDLIDLSMAHDAQHDDDDDNDNDFGSQVSVGAFDFDERLPSPPPTQREPARQQQRGRVQQLHRAVEEEHARVCARGARKLRRTREPVERNDGNKSRAQGRKYAAQPRGRYGQPREGSEGDEEAWYSDDLGLVPDNHPHAHDYSVPERDVGSRAQVGARRGASKGRGRSKGQSNAAEAAVGVDEQKLDELDPVRNVRQVIQRRPVHLPDNNANSAGCAQMMNDLIKVRSLCLYSRCFTCVTTQAISPS
jgi:hypothetical protein